MPIGSKSEYEAVSPWCNFKTITEMDFAGIGETLADGDRELDIAVGNGSLTVNGAAESEPVTVYDARGSVVYRGMERTIIGLPRGIYIVKVGAATAKAAI